MTKFKFNLSNFLRENSSNEKCSHNSDHIINHHSENDENDDEDELNEPGQISENSLRKAKSHGQRTIAMFYCFVVFAIGLALTLYNTGTRTAELEPSYVAFYVLIYITSVVGMCFTLLYIYQNRHASLEAIEKGELSARRIAFSFRGESVNLYLRIGIGLFAAMSIVYSSTRCYELVFTSHNTKDPILGVYTFFKILFFVVQTIFLLFLHRIVILVRVRLFNFILLHILTVNLCIWADAAIKKISKSLSYMTGLPETHHPVLATNESKTLSSKHGFVPTDYFLPAVPEYCAIALAVVYELSHRVGQLKQIEAHHEKKHHQSQNILTPGRIGILIGCTIITIVMTIILLLETSWKKISDYKLVIHLSETSVLFVVAQVFCFVGLLNTRKLKFSVNFANQNLDSKLLNATFFITITFLIACIIMCCSYLIADNLPTHLHDCMIIQLISVCLELAQVLGQNYFIADSFYRCCHNKIYLKQKPGRAMIALLAAINFALWMIYSFQVKHNNILFNVNSTYGEEIQLQSLYIFINVALPMVMLYRYHSSVCLAIAYVRIYEDEVSRYESMLRGVPHSKPMPFGSQWEIMETNSMDPNLSITTTNTNNLNDLSNISMNNIQSKTRNRAVSEPVVSSNINALSPNKIVELKPESFILAANQSLQSPEKINILKYPQNKRRTTHFNMELAHYRIQASEMGHRLTELRLQKVNRSKSARLQNNQPNNNNNSDTMNIIKNDNKNSTQNPNMTSRNLINNATKSKTQSMITDKYEPYSISDSEIKNNKHLSDIIDEDDENDHNENDDDDDNYGEEETIVGANSEIDGNRKNQQTFSTNL